MFVFHIKTFKMYIQRRRSLWQSINHVSNFGSYRFNSAFVKIYYLTCTDAFVKSERVYLIYLTLI